MNSVASKRRRPRQPFTKPVSQRAHSKRSTNRFKLERASTSHLWASHRLNRAATWIWATHCLPTRTVIQTNPPQARLTSTSSQGIWFKRRAFRNTKGSHLGSSKRRKLSKLLPRLVSHQPQCHSRTKKLRTHAPPVWINPLMGSTTHRLNRNTQRRGRYSKCRKAMRILNLSIKTVIRMIMTQISIEWPRKRGRLTTKCTRATPSERSRKWRLRLHWPRLGSHLPRWAGSKVAPRGNHLLRLGSLFLLHLKNSDISRQLRNFWMAQLHRRHHSFNNTILRLIRETNRILESILRPLKLWGISMSIKPTINWMLQLKVMGKKRVGEREVLALHKPSTSLCRKKVRS